MTEMLQYQNFEPFSIQENLITETLKILLLNLFKKKGAELKKIISSGKQEGKKNKKFYTNKN